MALTINDFGIGKDNAVTREHLVLKTGMSDRKVRKEISRLRSEGNVIMSSPHNNGYWIPNDYDELEAYISTMEHYAKACLVAIKSAKKLLRAKDQKQIGIVI